MSRVAKDAGATFQLVFIPVPDDVQSALGLTYVAEARRELESVAREGGFSFLDLTPRFRAETAAGAVLFIAGDGHWTPAGHELAARLLAASPGA
jgi:hypothetical protein